MIDIWAGFAATGRTSWPRFPSVRALAASAGGNADLAAEHHCESWR